MKVKAIFVLGESCRSAAMAIRANLFRAFLTALGIIIGVASVVTVVSLIQGFRLAIERQFQGLGSNSLTVSAYTPPMDELKGLRAKLSQDDVADLRAQIAGVEAITPTLESVQETRYRGRTHSTFVRGTTPAYLEVNATQVDGGRFLVPQDLKTRNNVAVIGVKLAEKLNLPADPLGTHFQIAGEWFKIVGVLEKKGESFGFSMDDYVIIPYPKATILQNEMGAPDISVQISITDNLALTPMKQQIANLLRRNHGLKEGEPDDFRIETQEEITATFGELMNGITLVIGGVVAISLLVGGIGIMNIMLVSVTERTREIGVRKALGAKRNHILLQFLTEAVLISFVAGALGLLIGMGVSQAVAGAIPQLASAYTPPWAAVLAFGFSVGTGIVFGILPAMKAAALDPIEALQYE